MLSIVKNMMSIFNMRKYNMRYDHVIHPILKYKVSKQGQISSYITCKYNKIKRCPMIKRWEPQVEMMHPQA